MAKQSFRGRFIGKTIRWFLCPVGNMPRLLRCLTQTSTFAETPELKEQWDTEKGRVPGNPIEAQLVNSQITQARAKLEKLYLVLSAQFESGSFTLPRIK